jgi:N-acetyl-gamma-glutamyl-phosphate reductase
MSTTDLIKVGIAGGTGLVAGELLRLLLFHSKVEIDFVYSHSQAGKKVSESHADLAPLTGLTFTDRVNSEVDVLFLALGHGNSTAFLKEYSFSEKTRIIDLSNDFRLNNDASFDGKTFIYGLPELNKPFIEQAGHIANPGCFATAIQLTLLPLAKHGLLNDHVHIHAITGATGAGRTLAETTGFNWRNNNVSVYKSFTHQHLGEITESVVTLQPGFDRDINFVPMRGSFARGILASTYIYSDVDEKTAVEIFKDFYKDQAFSFVSEQPVNLKQVVNTNFAFVNVKKHDNKLHITSVIDNLLKGAAGQAVHNMNLMLGWDEREGLRLKASAF